MLIINEGNEPIKEVSRGSVDLSNPDEDLKYIPLSNGDRILLTGQQNPLENGIYTYWERKGFKRSIFLFLCCCEKRIAILKRKLK